MADTIRRPITNLVDGDTFNKALTLERIISIHMMLKE